MSETWLYLMIKQADCSRTFNEKPTWWIAGLMRKVATLAQIVQNLYEGALKLFTCVYPYFGIYYPIMTNIFNVEKIYCKLVGRFRYKNSNSSSRNTLTPLCSVILDESLRIRGHSLTTLTRFWLFFDHLSTPGWENLQTVEIFHYRLCTYLVLSTWFMNTP